MPPKSTPTTLTAAALPPSVSPPAISSSPEAKALARTLLPPHPDTSRIKPIQYRPVSTADPSTTAVNLVGGATAAIGLGFAVAGLTAEAPQTEWGSLSRSFGIVTGLVLLLAGVALLLFQGENGRLRRLREARKAAAAPAPTPIAEMPVAAPARPLHKLSGLSKAGRWILIGTGAMVLLGILVGAPLFLLVPLGVLLLLAGLILYVAGR